MHSVWRVGVLWAILGLVVAPVDASAGLVSITVGDADFEQSIVPSGNGARPNNESPWESGTIIGAGTIFHPGGDWVPDQAGYYGYVLPGTFSEYGQVGNIEYSNGTISDLMQTLSVNVQPFTTYTLTVDVANRLIGNALCAYRIELLDGESVLASFDNPEIPNGSWVTAQVQYTTGETVAGGSLGIRFSGLPVGEAAWVQTFLDNVRLTAEGPDSPEPVVPEPSAMAIFLLGAVGTMVGAWRRRK